MIPSSYKIVVSKRLNNGVKEISDHKEDEDIPKLSNNWLFLLRTNKWVLQKGVRNGNSQIHNYNNVSG